MKIFNKLAIGATALAGAASIGVGAIYAATPSGATAINPMNKLVTAIASKFNLDSTEVQKVFDEQRTQMDQERQAQQTQRQKATLDQAVKDGKLTQAQEDLIVAKQTEMQAFMESLKGKTQDERQTAMKTQTDELQAWAKTNNISQEYLMFGRGGGQRGEGMGEMRDPKATLDQAVKEGKLTQAQEDLIVAKQEEQKTFMDNLKDKSQTERDAAIKTQAESLKSWATANGIDEQYVMPMGHGGRGAGRGHGMGPGDMMGQSGDLGAPPTDAQQPSRN